MTAAAGEIDREAVLAELAASPHLRAWLERMVAGGLDLLDDLDARTEELEPDHEDEVVSEDDGVVRNLEQVGYQAAVP